jgi:Fe-S cluster assembly ATP-binding protein
MMQGKIVKSGGVSLMKTIDKDGYDWIKEELGIDDEKVVPEKEEDPVLLESCATKEATK